MSSQALENIADKFFDDQNILNSDSESESDTETNDNDRNVSIGSQKAGEKVNEKDDDKTNVNTDDKTNVNTDQTSTKSRSVKTTTQTDKKDNKIRSKRVDEHHDKQESTVRLSKQNTERRRSRKNGKENNKNNSKINNKNNNKDDEKPDTDDSENETTEDSSSDNSGDEEVKTKSRKSSKKTNESKRERSAANTDNESTKKDSNASSGLIKNKKLSGKEFETAKPLTEQDIMLIRKRLANLESKALDSILNSYSQLVSGIITMALKITKEDDEIAEIEHLRRLIIIVPKDELFIRSKDKIWDAREKILNKDADWFIKRDYSKLIKKDSKQTMIETLVNVVKRYYPELDDDEKNMYWKKAIGLLQVVAEYKKIAKET
jgi:hypothetical protein